MSAPPEFRRVIGRAASVISQCIDQTTDATESNKLQFALTMVRQAEEYLEEGKQDASWLRLVGALDFLRMTPATRGEMQTLRAQMDALIDG